jgi:hypothetical protein
VQEVFAGASVAISEDSNQPQRRLEKLRGAAGKQVKRRQLVAAK